MPSSFDSLRSHPNAKKMVQAPKSNGKHAKAVYSVLKIISVMIHRSLARGSCEIAQNPQIKSPIQSKEIPTAHGK